MTTLRSLPIASVLVLPFAADAAAQAPPESPMNGGVPPWSR